IKQRPVNGGRPWSGRQPEKEEAAGGGLTVRQAPPPARHRPGARSARRGAPLSFYRRQYSRRRRPMGTRSLLNSLKCWRSVAGVRRPYRRPNTRLVLETLEDRCVPAVLPVTSTLDDATHPGTLRYAVAHADDGDTIAFTPALQGAPIVLTQGELLLDHDVTFETIFDGVQTISGGGPSRVIESALAA